MHLVPLEERHSLIILKRESNLRAFPMENGSGKPSFVTEISWRREEAGLLVAAMRGADQASNSRF
jgi:hypothetical protein